MKAISQKVIGSFAVDGLHLSEEHKEDLRRIDRGELTTTELIAQIKEKHRKHKLQMATHNG